MKPVMLYFRGSLGGNRSSISVFDILYSCKSRDWVVDFLLKYVSVTRIFVAQRLVYTSLPYLYVLATYV